jgi:ribonuclease J
VEPLIICLVQPAPAGTPAYKGRADAEPDSRPAPRGRSARDGGVREVVARGRDGAVPAPQRQLVAVGAAAPAATPVSAPTAAPAAVVAEVSAPAPAELEPEPAGRTRRRRSAAIAG